MCYLVEAILQRNGTLWNRCGRDSEGRKWDWVRRLHCTKRKRYAICVNYTPSSAEDAPFLGFCEKETFFISHLSFLQRCREQRGVVEQGWWCISITRAANNGQRCPIHWRAPFVPRILRGGIAAAAAAHTGTLSVENGFAMVVRFHAACTG